MRIDTLCGIFAASISTYLVYGGRVSAGSAGFTISVVLTFARQMMWWVRTYTLLELQGEETMLYFRLHSDVKIKQRTGRCFKSASQLTF